MPSNDGTTYIYHQQNGGANYCVTITNTNSTYTITDSSTSPAVGSCAGDPQGGQSQITNLVLNPSFETNTTGWTSSWGTSGTGTTTRMTNGGKSGSAYYRMVWSVAPSVNWGGINGKPFSVTVGQPYTVSTWVRTTSTQTLRASLRADTYPTTSDASGPLVTVQPNTWTLLTTTDASVPSGVSTLYPFVSRNATGTWQVGDTLDTDAIILTQSTNQYNYADGNSPGWIGNGTANNSTSTGPPQ